MSLKVGPRSQPAPAIDDDRSHSQSTTTAEPAAPAAPAEEKSKGWLAGIGNAVARNGRGQSEFAKQMRGWVAGGVNAMEQATAPGPNANVAAKALHFGTTVAGGAIEGLASLPADYLDARGKLLQLADPAARAKAAEGVKAIAANPSAVASSMAADAWKQATERPGHTLGNVGVMLAPFGAAKLAGLGRAGEAAATTARAAEAVADSTKAVETAKAVMDEPARAVIAQFDRMASASNAEIAQMLQRPRPVGPLISDLAKANPKDFMAEGLKVLKLPAEMRTAAQAYLGLAPNGSTGTAAKQAVSTAMDNLRLGVQKFAPAEQHASWGRVLDELSTTLPR